MACIIFVAVVITAIAMSGCGRKDSESEGVDEVGDIIFDSDTVTITAVSTDEYLDVFENQKIHFAHFADSDIPIIMGLGGATLSVIQGDKLYDQLNCAVLTVFENGEEYDITDMLEEFFICQMEDGTIKMYYEVYNEYGEEEDGKMLKKYINLKAYCVEFKNGVSKEDLEFI